MQRHPGLLLLPPPSMTAIKKVTLECDRTRHPADLSLPPPACRLAWSGLSTAGQGRKSTHASCRPGLCMSARGPAEAAHLTGMAASWRQVVSAPARADSWTSCTQEVCKVGASVCQRWALDQLAARARNSATNRTQEARKVGDSMCQIRVPALQGRGHPFGSGRVSGVHRQLLTSGTCFCAGSCPPICGVLTSCFICRTVPALPAWVAELGRLHAGASVEYVTPL